MSAMLALVTFFLLSGPGLFSPPEPAQTASQTLAASPQISIPSPPAAPTAGSLVDGVYTNEYFRFSYRLPEQWESSSQAANPFQANPEESSSGSSDLHQDGARRYLLLSAGQRGTNNALQVVAYDTGEQSGITARDVAVAEVGALCSLGGTAQETTETTIAGRTFSIGKAQITGEVRGQSQPIYAGIAAVKEGSYILTWSFFSDSASHLEQMLATLESIRFEK